MDHLTLDEPVEDLPVDAEARARSVLARQLRDSEAMTIIANTLNGIERRHAGLPLCRLGDLPLGEMRRLIGKATAIVRSCDPEVETDAVDEVAHLICEGKDREYSRLEHQPVRTQANFRQWARRTVDAYWGTLEGNRG